MVLHEHRSVFRIRKRLKRGSLLGCLGLLAVGLASAKGCQWLHCYVDQRNDLGNVMGCICLAEDAFKEAGVRDLDDDGIGEYGRLRELLEWISDGREEFWAKVLKDIDPESGVYWGYTYLSIEVGVRSGGGTMGIDGAEATYLATAWPMRYGTNGYFTFRVDQTGDIRYRDNGGRPAAPESIADRSSWLAFWKDPGRRSAWMKEVSKPWPFQELLVPTQPDR
jgi:hypothetical protein